MSTLSSVVDLANKALSLHEQLAEVKHQLVEHKAYLRQLSEYRNTAAELARTTAELAACVELSNPEKLPELLKAVAALTLHCRKGG